jgi:hypothetical protein
VILKIHVSILGDTLKTINTGKGRRLAGKVTVQNKEIYVDTSDGTGFHEVFQTMEPIINSIAIDHHAWGAFSNFDDAKQDICLAMLEAIAKYNPKRGATLSTFLYAVGNNRAIDAYRRSIRGRTKYLCYVDELSYSFHCYDPDLKIELIQRIAAWDDRWRNIMFRIFVKGDKISGVAKDEDFTPWGLTRAVRRKLQEARKI